MPISLQILEPDPNPGPYNAIHPCIYKSSCAPKYSVGKKLKPLNLDQGSYNVI